MIDQRIVKEYFNSNDYVVVEYHFEGDRIRCNIEKRSGDTYLNKLYWAYYNLLSLNNINRYRYSINSIANLRYLQVRLKYDDDTTDAKEELKEEIVGEDIINVLREVRRGEL